MEMAALPTLAFRRHSMRSSPFLNLESFIAEI